MRPRIGFLGVGWIGRNRMQALVERGIADIVAIADPSPERRTSALEIVPDALACADLGELLELPLDGVVIATPSALHAEHCLAALERGRAVFCQKPLGRSAGETAMVVDAARDADRLLAVDLSYRYTTAIRAIRAQLGEIGRVFAIDLVFHNAYGPEAAWFYEKESAGGGCVIDLGVHLVDLALWLLDFPRVTGVDSRLFCSGEAIDPDGNSVEDFAHVQLQLESGAIVRLACSWRVSAGCDAVIAADIFGTRGGLAMRNVAGSFYDFVAERFRGTQRERLATPPDAWGGRALVDWTERLATGTRFDRSAERLVDVARVLDMVYERGALDLVRGVA
jgi:predicted dehydrogenase